MAKHLKHDWRSAKFDASDKILCEWAVKLTLTPGEMTREDVDGLKEVGFSDQAISDAAQVVGYFNYINRIAEGLGVDLEPEMKKRK